MSKLTQKDFNSAADYYYRMQRDETTHQNSRMMWIITTQTLVFAGICTIIDKVEIVNNPILPVNTVMFGLLLIIGCLTAISAVYSSLVSEISIGTTLDDWDRYNNLPVNKKPNPVNHRMIAVPKRILDSHLKWLDLHTFVPKVFLSAWIILVMYIIWGNVLDFTLIYIIFYFGCALILVHCVFYLYRFILETQIKQLHHQSTNMDIQTTSMNNTVISTILNSPLCKCKCCSNHCCKNENTFAIYQIIIDRFKDAWTIPPSSENEFMGGNLKGIIEELSYIKFLGFNTIMLTPIYESASFHGYHITDYTKIEPSFGNWEHFSELVVKSHRLGMKVICDFVPNHCHESHPFFQNALHNGDKRNWFYFHSNNTYTHFLKYSELPKFNLNNPEVKQYFIQLAKELVLYGVDGIRIDHAVGVPFSFLQELRNAVKTINEDVFVFGEVLPVHPDYVEQIEFKSKDRKEQMKNGTCKQDYLQLDYIGVLDGVLDFAYKDIIINELNNGREISSNNQELMAKLYRHFRHYSKEYQPILFLDNPDTDRIMFSCNNNKSVLDQVVAFTKSLNYPYCILYGTEQYMCNKIAVSDQTPYSDLGVRLAMDWS